MNSWFLFKFEIQIKTEIKIKPWMNTKNVRYEDDWIELEFNEDVISKIDKWIEFQQTKHFSCS